MLATLFCAPPQAGWKFDTCSLAWIQLILRRPAERANKLLLAGRLADNADWPAGGRGQRSLPMARAEAVHLRRGCQPTSRPACLPACLAPVNRTPQESGEKRAFERRRQSEAPRAGERPTFFALQRPPGGPAETVAHLNISLGDLSARGRKLNSAGRK